MSSGYQATGVRLVSYERFKLSETDSLYSISLPKKTIELIQLLGNRIGNEYPFKGNKFQIDLTRSRTVITSVCCCTISKTYEVNGRITEDGTLETMKGIIDGKAISSIGAKFFEKCVDLGDAYSIHGSNLFITLHFKFVS